MWEWRDIPQPKSSEVAIDWFESKLNKAILEIDDHFSKFRISDALMSIYKLIWDDFCAWYLEMIKPGYQQPIDAKTLEATISYFEILLKLAHPFTPFITEELWHWLRDRKEGEDILISEWPKAGAINETILTQFDNATEVITNIRNIRKQNNIANKVDLEMYIKVNASDDHLFNEVIQKMGNLSKFDYCTEKIQNTFSFIVKNNEYFIPFGEEVDIEEERKKIEAELEYAQGSLNIVLKKLNNERFMAGAPEQVVASERKKEADALNKIKILTEKLAELA